MVFFKVEKYVLANLTNQKGFGPNPVSSVIGFNIHLWTRSIHLLSTSNRYHGFTWTKLKRESSLETKATLWSTAWYWCTYNYKMNKIIKNKQTLTTRKLNNIKMCRCFTTFSRLFPLSETIFKSKLIVIPSFRVIHARIAAMFAFVNIFNLNWEE